MWRATYPHCGDVFVFRSKRSERIKLLAWDGSGMVLVTKWLEEGRFALKLGKGYCVERLAQSQCP
jgi:transposase